MWYIINSHEKEMELFKKLSWKSVWGKIVHTRGRAKDNILKEILNDPVLIPLKF